MQRRLEVLINGTTEPLTAGIHYHRKCYLNYVTRATQVEDDGKIECLGSLKITEVRERFLKEVENKIFVEGEPTTLKQLLKEYESFLLDHGIIRTSLKTYDIKLMLEERFEERIGFHNRYRRNESTLVYDNHEGGTFLEAALNCWCVTHERLFEIAGKRLKENINNTTEPMKWPLTTDELCKYQEPHPLLHSFVKNISSKGGPISLRYDGHSMI